jgi:hypothetical protein
MSQQVLAVVASHCTNLSAKRGGQLRIIGQVRVFIYRQLGWPP